MDRPIEGITVARPGIRLTIPPEHVRDLQRLFALESLGFLRSGSIQFDPREPAFVLELEGDAVSHLIELLEIATSNREAETWPERIGRAADQFELSFSGSPT